MLAPQTYDHQPHGDLWRAALIGAIALVVLGLLFWATAAANGCRQANANMSPVWGRWVVRAGDEPCVRSLSSIAAFRRM